MRNKVDNVATAQFVPFPLSLTETCLNDTPPLGSWTYLVIISLISQLAIGVDRLGLVKSPICSITSG